MNRNQWTFAHSAATLLKAAQDKRAHHASRLAWWTQKRGEVLAAIKERGIEVEESVAANQFSNSTYNRGAQVSIDQTLVRDMQECATKAQEHRTKMVEYDAWMQVLAANNTATLQLHHDDWLFFFGNGVTVTEIEQDEAA